MKNLILLLSCTLLCFFFSCCQKEEVSPLNGTSWEEIEHPGILVFYDNHSGVYYTKSATDDVYDDIYSSFDFTYAMSGNNVTLHIFFSRYDTFYDLVLGDDETLSSDGKVCFKKIHHKVNVMNVSIP